MGEREDMEREDRHAPTIEDRLTRFEQAFTSFQRTVIGTLAQVNAALALLLESVTTREVTIIDEKGRPAVTIRAGKDGGMVLVNDNTGELRAVLAASDRGGVVCLRSMTDELCTVGAGLVEPADEGNAFPPG